MKIIFDIVHPAHVHFFKHILWGLEGKGHECKVLAREKDVTCDLLDKYKIAYESVGKAGKKSRLGQLAELLQRDNALRKISKQFRPDLILTRNPAGVQAARLCGALGVFDTDDLAEESLNPAFINKKDVLAD